MCVLDELAYRGWAITHSIEKFEGELLAGKSPGEGRVTITEKDLPVENFYARSLWRPAGTFIIGHRHRDAHTCWLKQGRLNVFSDGVVTRHMAGDVWEASAGGRKATFVPEDCKEGATLVTFHKTSVIDFTKLENELIEKSEAFLVSELPTVQEALK